MDAAELRNDQPAGESLLAAVGYGLLFVGHLLVWPFTSGSDAGSFVEIGACLALGFFCIATFGTSGPAGVRVPSSAIIPISLSTVYFAVSIIAAIFAGDTKNIAWILFGACLLFFIVWRNPVYSSLLDGLRITSFAAVIAYIWYNATSVFTFAGGRGRVSFGNEAYTLTAYAVATGAVVALYCLSRRHGRWPFNALLLVCALLALVGTGTRSVYLGLSIVVARLAISAMAERKGHLGRIVVICALAFTSLFALSFVPGFSERSSAILRAVSGGAQAFLGRAVEEQSALGRFYNRQIGFDNFAEHPLVGSGYKTKWLDFPLLQAFQDFGIFFGVVFGLMMFVIPVIIAWRGASSRSAAVGIISLLYLANAPRLFLHGQPYDWVLYPFVLPVFGIMLSKRRRGIQISH